MLVNLTISLMMVSVIPHAHNHTTVIVMEVIVMLAIQLVRIVLVLSPQTVIVASTPPIES